MVVSTHSSLLPLTPYYDNKACPLGMGLLFSFQFHKCVYFLILLLLIPLITSLSSQRLVPFHKFTFAQNNVCINPYRFIAADHVDGKERILEFSMRNVPGEGDCMFLAVALATSTSMGLGGNDALLRAIANETREVVAQVLSAKEGTLHVEKRRLVRARDLLSSAAKKEGVTNDDYIQLLRNGTLQGGGPELTVLSNVLRRPISVYELVRDDQFQDDVPSTCNIKCVGSFGDVFIDPLFEIPDHAVISGLQEGAYSWHIHVLVVDAGQGEKHACALLPKQCYDV